MGKLYHLYFFVRYWWLRRKYMRRVARMRKLAFGRDLEIGRERMQGHNESNVNYGTDPYGAGAHLEGRD